MAKPKKPTRGLLLSPVAVLCLANQYLEAAADLQDGQHAVAVHLPVTHYL